ncbi:MAG: serine protease, partial [Verrucomicrobiota bacterium]
MDNYKDFLVQVFARSADGRTALGTAYPVGRDCLLTARHVVCPDGQPAEEIEIRWKHVDQDSEWREARIAWDEKHLDLDAVLLVTPTPFPEGVKPGLLSDEPPADLEAWSSEGFAVAGKKDGAWSGVSLSGAMYSSASSNNLFELGVDYHTEQSGGWKGASGSPVTSRGRIVGILSQCPDAFPGNRLQAVPCWKLLKNSAFRSRVGFTSLADRKKEVIKMVGDSIRSHEDLVRQILKRTRADASPDDGLEDHELAARALFQDDLKSFFTEMNELHDAYCRAGKQKTAEEIMRVVMMVGPVVGKGFDLFEPKRPFEARGAHVRTNSGVELAMARSDGAEMKFRHSTDDRDFPEGDYKLPIAPETGIDPEEKEFENNWREMLAGLFVDSSLAGSGKVDQMIRSKMRYRRDRSGRNFYFPFLSQEADDPDQADFLARMTHLQ